MSTDIKTVMKMWCRAQKVGRLFCYFCSWFHYCRQWSG